MKHATLDQCCSLTALTALPSEAPIVGSAGGVALIALMPHAQAV